MITTSRLYRNIYNNSKSKYYSSISIKKMFKAENICGVADTNFAPKLLSVKHSNLFSTNVVDRNKNLSAEPEMIPDSSYEGAVKALNKLQSNAVTLQKSIQNVSNPQKTNLNETIKYLNRSGFSLNKLDKLSIIHVSGTKGKGSTCALTESILNAFGAKTGFFSSPHLISVTERFRINCKPISKEKFAKCFWKVYNNLKKCQENDADMPAYFKFLTILSFHIFFEEKVDVIILEVGIGGENDCTNIVRNTKTVGITSLGLEHTNLLGNSLGEIAWQKAGIIKEKSNVFTTIQPEECMKIIRKRTSEKNAKLFLVPDYSSYNWTEVPTLQIGGKVQHLNASLAIQLSYDWLRHNKFPHLNEFSKAFSKETVMLEVSEKLKQGLENCFWPGRCQIINFHNLRIYLDGAHTEESIKICIDWFNESTKKSSNNKVLIFNTTGDRDSKKLMDILMEINFKMTCFVPNIPFDDKSKLNDTVSIIYSHQEQIYRAQAHYEYWNSFENKFGFAKRFANIVDAFQSISNTFDKNEQINVLVTGSLHLIGASLLALEEFDKIKA